MWRRAALAALTIIYVSGIIALVEAGSRGMYRVVRIIHDAKTDFSRPKDRKVVGISSKPVYVKRDLPAHDLSNLCLCKQTLRWPYQNVTYISSGHRRFCVVSGRSRISRLLWQCTQMKGNFFVDNEGLRSAGIGRVYLGIHRLIGDEWIRRECHNIEKERRTLALNEGQSLNPTDYCQNEGKNANDPSPSDHGPIKGIIWLAIITFGAWMGVWSIGFWDSLGRWRWLLSALGWAVMIVCLVQGFPGRP